MVGADVNVYKDVLAVNASVAEGGDCLGCQGSHDGVCLRGYKSAHRFSKCAPSISLGFLTRNCCTEFTLQHYSQVPRQYLEFKRRRGLSENPTFPAPLALAEYTQHHLTSALELLRGRYTHDAGTTNTRVRLVVR